MNTLRLQEVNPGLVSILVLNWNRPDLTIKAVESLIKNTLQNTEIIVIDNGSEPQKARRLGKFCESKNIKFLEIGTNRFFGEGNNIGAEATSGEYLVFLNNDVQVGPDWLTPLLETIALDPTVGAVGPKFVYPNGILQEAGAFVDKNGNSVQIGKGQDADDPRFNLSREVHYVSAACLLMRKSDFLKIQGFNFIYEPAYYEDTELCFSIRSLGKRVIYQPKSLVVHQESATTADPASSLKLNNISEINRLKFLNRWANGQVPSRFSGPNERFVQQGQKRVGIYTPFHLTLGGGERYILSVAEALSDCNLDVDLITDFAFSRLRLAQLSHMFSLNLTKTGLVNLHDQRLPPYDLLISMGNEVVPSIEPLGKKNIFHCQFPFPSHGKVQSRSEDLKRVDVIVVNSNFTDTNYREAASRLGVEVSVEVIEPPVELSASPSRIKSPHKILSVGRFFVGGHMKRQDALIDAFKDLSTRYPDASLELVGGVLPGNEHRKYLESCVKKAEGLNVNFYVDAEQEVLQELYSSSSIYWHGTGYEVDFANEPEKCEHFGISLVEAMSAGLIPVAVGSGGPKEIIDFGVNGFLFQTLGNLARRTELLFSLDENDLDIMRDHAIQTSKKYGKEVFSSKWQALARNLLEN